MASDDDCYDYEYDYDEDEEEEEEAMEADEDGLFEDDTPMPDRPADCWVSKPIDQRRPLRPRLLPD